MSINTLKVSWMGVGLALSFRWSRLARLLEDATTSLEDDFSRQVKSVDAAPTFYQEFAAPLTPFPESQPGDDSPKLHGVDLSARFQEIGEEFGSVPSLSNESSLRYEPSFTSSDWILSASLRVRIMEFADQFPICPCFLSVHPYVWDVQ